ncbi:MAG: GntR family transcriptional regulator [Lachnospiraceae bacterium]|nr:GntR family transcriptional regulator [Lachnospiraceae bacterium]
MNITIQTKSGVPIYEQIGKAIKADILEGKLRKDEPLPSIRSLAADLRISVITTKRAYEDLEKEGMIYSVPGKGFFVDNPDREYLAEKRNMSVEEDLTKVIEEAKNAGLTKEQFINMLEIIWEE